MPRLPATYAAIISILLCIGVANQYFITGRVTEEALTHFKRQNVLYTIAANTATSTTGDAKIAAAATGGTAESTISVPGEIDNQSDSIAHKEEIGATISGSSDVIVELLDQTGGG